jgi:predicted translin family RNA/ssDNA-binding protein
MDHRKPPVFEVSSEKMKIDKQAFAAMRRQLAQYDSLRDELIKASRDALTLSKKAIYSLHRAEIAIARKQLAAAKNVIERMHKLIARDAHLAATGAYNEALEEYVEAACYFSLLTKKALPTAKQLGVDIDSYLPGLCDLVGELVRKAVNSAINGDAKTALEIRDVVTQIYQELMLFDFRNLPVRRKFDSIKYGLEKLEDLALQIKLKKR